MGAIYSKKGQMETLETIMVLVVVVIILAMGIFYYYKFYIGEVEEKETGLSDIERDVLLASVLTLPEIQCSFNAIEQDCIDMKKVETNYIQDNKGEYLQKFGFRVIKIIEVYPGNSDKTIYSNIRLGYKTKNVVSMPVSLYFSNEDYRMGKLVVEDYQ